MKQIDAGTNPLVDAYLVVTKTNTPGFKIPKPPTNMPKPEDGPERMKEWIKTGR